MKKVLYLSLLGVLIIAGLLAVVSCGTSSATTPTTGTQAAPTQTGTTPGNNVTVQIANFSFSPATVEVAIGTTVTWTNQDSATHTVTSQTGAFDSGSMSQGANFSHTFTDVGDFEYHCAIHTSMVGHIIVK